MKKILVLGAAGFLMSNFIRYLLFRTKDYEVVGIDSLENCPDKKSIYINKKNQFYIGDITDLNFLNKVVSFEKPDYIINGADLCNNPLFSLESYSANLFKVICNLNMIARPYLQIFPYSTSDMYHINKAAKSLILKNTVFKKSCGNAVLEIPNCFGMRQKVQNGFARLIASAIKNEDNDEVYVNNIKIPWVYVEDVASLMWFILEKNIHGEVVMPTLCSKSIAELFETINKNVSNVQISTIESDLNHPYNNDFWSPIVIDEKQCSSLDWEPDTENVDDVINKTIQWYKINKWVFNI